VYTESLNFALFGKAEFLQPEWPDGHGSSSGRMRECDDYIFSGLLQAENKSDAGQLLRKKFPGRHCL